MKVLLGILMVLNIFACTHQIENPTTESTKLKFANKKSIHNGISYILEKGDNKYSLNLTVENDTRVIVTEEVGEGALAVISAKSGQQVSTLLKYENFDKSDVGAQIINKNFIRDLSKQNPISSSIIRIDDFLSMLPDNGLDRANEEPTAGVAFARSNLSSVSQISGGNVICIFGCGGGKTNSQKKQDCYDAVDKFNKDPSLESAREAARLCNLVDW